jgi:hypothetical protein
MKNKKLTYYVLIPAVLLIWGIIIYKISLKRDDFIESNIPSNVSRNAKTPKENEGYQLISNYPDPFFHESFQIEEESSDVQAVVKPKIEKKWPAIRFDGYILNGNKIKCHLTVNGEDKILQVQETILEDYVVSAITPDSIRINCQGNSRWYKKIAS